MRASDADASGRELKLPGIKQQKTGAASFFPAAIIADKDDLLLSIEDGGADPLGVFDALQAGNRNAADRITPTAAPEP